MQVFTLMGGYDYEVETLVGVFGSEQSVHRPCAGRAKPNPALRFHELCGFGNWRAGGAANGGSVGFFYPL
jgi:hypothetical protein